jgi:hypothetical protein
MVQLSGVYNDGQITLDQKVSATKPVKVMVTFMEDDVVVEEKPLNFNDFSFDQCREMLKDLNTSFSDAVIEERRSAR